MPPSPVLPLNRWLLPPPCKNIGPQECSIASGRSSLVYSLPVSIAYSGEGAVDVGRMMGKEKAFLLLLDFSQEADLWCVQNAGGFSQR